MNIGFRKSKHTQIVNNCKTLSACSYSPRLYTSNNPTKYAASFCLRHSKNENIDKSVVSETPESVIQSKIEKLWNLFGISGGARTLKSLKSLKVPSFWKFSNSIKPSSSRGLKSFSTCFRAFVSSPDFVNFMFQIVYEFFNNILDLCSKNKLATISENDKKTS